MPKAGKVPLTQKLGEKFHKLRTECNSLLTADYLAAHHQGLFGLAGSCVLHRCMRLDITCKTCEEKQQLAKYRPMDEEAGPVDLAPSAPVGRNTTVVIRFYLNSNSFNWDLENYYPLAVNQSMTAHHVITALAGVISVPNHYTYSLVEFWKDFEAERVVDDCEQLLPLQWEHQAAGQEFTYLYVNNVNKFDYARAKPKYFITPEEAWEKFANTITDPDLIQVRHPFFQKQMGIFSQVRKDSKTKKLRKSILSLVRSHSAGYDDRSPSTSSKGLLPGDESSPEPEIPEKELVNPTYCSTVYVKQSKRDYTIDELRQTPGMVDKSKWEKKYLLLRNRILFFVNDHSHMMKYYLMEDEKFARHVDRAKRSQRDNRLLKIIVSVDKVEAYMGSSAQKYFNSPFGGCIVLRRQVVPANKPVLMMFCPKTLKMDTTLCPEETAMSCNLWLTAIRFAKRNVDIIQDFMVYRAECMQFDIKKYLADEVPAVLGKLKKDVHKKMGNMPVFKRNEDKFERMNEERCSKKSLNASLLPDWMEEPKVSMDFSSGVGKLVGLDESNEEGTTPKTFRFEQCEQCPREAFGKGMHLTQKYYHGEITRQEAEEKLQAAAVNGSWLLRESNSRRNFLIVSYIYEGRCHHKYISAAPYVDQSSESGKARIYVATLDRILAFYSVHSLLEYYRLNKGEEMACMLGISVKNPYKHQRSPDRSMMSPASTPSTLHTPSRWSAGQDTSTYMYVTSELPKSSTGESADSDSAPAKEAASGEQLSTDTAAESALISPPPTSTDMYDTAELPKTSAGQSAELRSAPTEEAASSEELSTDTAAESALISPPPTSTDMYDTAELSKTSAGQSAEPGSAPTEGAASAEELSTDAAAESLSLDPPENPPSAEK